MDVCFLLTDNHLKSALESFFTFEKKTNKNFCLGVCHCLDLLICLPRMDLLQPCGGFTGHVNSYLLSMVRCSKVFRPHGILHGAIDNVYAERKSGPPYYYVVGSDNGSCFLDTSRDWIVFLKLVIEDFSTLYFYSASLLTTLISTCRKDEEIFIYDIFINDANFVKLTHVNFLYLYSEEKKFFVFLTFHIGP